MTGGSAGKMYDEIISLKNETELKEHDVKYYIQQAMTHLESGDRQQAIRDLEIAVDLIVLQ